MSENLALVIAGAMSCFGLGWAVGRWIKAIRRFMEQIV